MVDILHSCGAVVMIPCELCPWCQMPMLAVSVPEEPETINELNQLES